MAKQANIYFMERIVPRATGCFVYGGGVNLRNKVNELRAKGYQVILRDGYLEYFGF